MELTKTTQPAKTVYVGVTNLGMSAGKYLKVETTPNGEEILNDVVPTGKQWTVQIRVDVVEIDT